MSDDDDRRCPFCGGPLEWCGGDCVDDDTDDDDARPTREARA